MKMTIKKYKGNWLVDDNNGGWVGFTTIQEATQYAYNEGAAEVWIEYSSNVGRIFTREAMENFNLVVKA